VTKRLSIRSKLMVLLILSGISGALTISVLSYVHAERALREATWNQLVATRETKRECLLRWVDQQFRAFRVFSGEEQLPAAYGAFRAGFDAKAAQLDRTDEQRLVEFYEETFLPALPDRIAERSLDDYLPTTRAGARLQLDYLVDNPHPAGEKSLLETRNPSLFAETGVDAYDEAHRRYHAFFVRLMTEMNLYDLFLVDARNGDVLYTVSKETDFGTNLDTGPYRQSNLAEAYRKARDGRTGDEGVVLVDFDHYRPSFGAPAAFLAAPVVEDGQVVAVVAGQISIDAINDAMTSGGRWQAEGLGNSGEVYLVGPDRTARTDSRFLIEDRDAYLGALRDLGIETDVVDAIAESGHSIISQELDTAAVDQALAGRSGTAIVDDYRGIPVMSAYAPFQIGEMRWGILAEKDVSEALGPLYDLRTYVLAATATVAVVLTLFALWAARVFLGPIARLQRGVERLKEGEVDFRIDAAGNDEFAALGGAFNDMIAEIAQRNRTIAEKTTEYEDLLRNVLPEAVADRYSGGEPMIADTFQNVSIVYASIDGISRMMRGQVADDTIRLLNELVDGFDDAAERHGVEKIKTVGDAYLAACGLSTPRLDHRQRAQAFAEDMESVLNRFNNAKGLDLTLQIGLASGEVDAGIVGRRRFVYEILGDCVTEARRLAYTASGPGIHAGTEFAAAVAAPPRTMPTGVLGRAVAIDDPEA